MRKGRQMETPSKTSAPLILKENNENKGNRNENKNEGKQEIEKRQARKRKIMFGFCSGLLAFLWPKPCKEKECFFCVNLTLGCFDLMIYIPTKLAEL